MSYTIEKTFQGAYKLSDIQGNHLISHQYFTPKKEAVKLFREKLLHEFLKRNIGLHSIAHSERKAAERLEAKGVITITRHKNATWQVRLKEG